MKQLAILFFALLLQIGFSQSPNFEFQFADATVDCNSNQLNYQILAKVDVVQTEMTLMTMRVISFDQFFTDPLIEFYDKEGNVVNGSNVQYIQDGNGTSGSGLFDINSDMYYISGELRHRFLTTDWQVIGSITFTAHDNLLFGEFCPVIIFEENISTGTGLFPGSSGIVCTSLTGVQGNVSVIHNNWVQFFADGSGAVTSQICLNQSCSKDILPQFTAHNGDIYSNNACYGLVLTSPDGSCWRLTVDDQGVTTSKKVDCP